MGDRTICVYVGDKSRENLEVGLQTCTWGFKDWRLEYELIEVGDSLLLATGFTGGSPRVQLTVRDQCQLN